MKDYWRLIGITGENASEDQIRQAHFRAFRFYQGRKNESKNAAQRAIAELAIDYLRSAQNNPDLPMPDSLRSQLPASADQAQAPDQITSATMPATGLAITPINIPQAKPVQTAKSSEPTALANRAITFDGRVFIIRFPAEDKIVEAVKELPSCWYNTVAGHWSVSPTVGAVKPILALARAYYFRLDESARQCLDSLAKNGKAPTRPPSVEAATPIKASPVPPTEKIERPHMAQPVHKAEEIIPPTEKLAPIVKAAPVAETKFEDDVDLELDPIFDSFDSAPPTTPIRPPTKANATDQLKPPAPPTTPIVEPALSAPVKAPDKLSSPISANDRPAVLSTTSSNRQIVLGEIINCPDCEWDIISQTDSYCSGCGKGITSVLAPKELIVYISDGGSYAKSFTITNDGLIPITINNFEVIDIAASVQPATAIVLGKNESLTAQLQVSEANQFGRRSGRLRFRYHDKPIEIAVKLKEPPRTWLAFPDIANAHMTVDGFHLKLPISQTEFTCKIATDSDSALTISSVKLGERALDITPIALQRDQPYLLRIEEPHASELILTLAFEELGSRRFCLALERVQAPNLIDQIDRYSIGEGAIILGSGMRESKLIIKNEFDNASGRGKGQAQKISFQGAPDWLALSPPVIDQIGAGESREVRLLIDSGKISAPCREHVELIINYYDPQLECAQRRPAPVQLPFEFIEPRAFDDWIAIDFGTSNSCAAMLTGAAIRSLIVDDLNANPQESPSCIQFVDEAQKIYECGMSAYSKRFSGPRAIKATAWAFKPQLSRSVEPAPQTYLDIVQGRAHTKTVDELVSIYARAIIQSVRLRNGITPRKAVVTFPVTFGKLQRERLAKAFRSGGLEEVITPVSEPVALAIHYAYLHREIFLKPSVFAVFDFGGGTTDLAIFQIQPPQDASGAPQFRLLDVSGIDLGGELLTFEMARAIYELLAPIAERENFAFPASLEELLSGNSEIARENYRRLADLAERVKRSFYKDDEIFEQEITLNLEGKRGNQSFKAQLQRNDVEALLKRRIEQLIDALIAMISALHDRAVIPARKLDWIILGGNSSRLPLVTEMLAEALFEGNRAAVLLDAENIKFGVTKGALLYAVAPDALPFPVDQVNHTLPCHVGLLAQGYRFDAIFERGLIAGDEGVLARRQMRVPRGQEYLRLYYYFGHEANPKVLDNPKMKEYLIPCAVVSGYDVEAVFRLLPDCEGIEVTLSAKGHETIHLAPILASS